VYDPDTADECESLQFVASSPDHAAEQFAARLDGMDGGDTPERTVMVAELGSDGWRRFSVKGEATVRYYAKEIDNDPLTHGDRR